ncbi:restriction endonuclease subunit S [Desemzia incerta]|uniref:restriction endonuclease subunit S n=1 Tax=Desemzia incerta TaxID=82801 RepID=UPI0024C3FCBA|nr:restriction endonuclease subunit S [Desemzia incerta]WHZ33172.1 restriction endonuclease subunit S [Desemzia incerta]
MFGDWEQRKLVELSESFEYGLNASAIAYDGENKYLRITDIDDASRKLIQNKLTSPEYDLKKADNYLLQHGDILFTRTGASVGKTYRYDEKDGKVYYAGFLIRARIKSTYNPEFIFQNTLTSKFKNFIRITSQRSGQPGINANEYGSFEIFIPNKEEQSRVASLFKHLDDTIALHQEKLEKLKQLKRAYLQVIFPQKGERTPRLRFADFSSDWEQRELSEIVERITRKNKNLESTLPLTISAQDGLINQNDFFNKQVASRDVSNYYLVKKGDFAYNKSYSNGYPWGAVKRLDSYSMGVLSTLYIVFIPTRVNSDFLVSYYDTTSWHKEVSKHAAEGARNHGLLNITASDFFKTKLSIPSSVDEQEKIGNFFRQFDDSIALQNAKVMKLKKLKEVYLKKVFI